jgi:hypothetical protein
MTNGMRQTILRANAFYLGASALAALLSLDLPQVLFGVGPQSRIVSERPYVAVGFVEAHGLAFVLSLFLWRATTDRFSHLASAGTAALLGTANLVFWDIFPAIGSLTMGYISTSLHWTFAAAQFLTAWTYRPTQGS